MEHYKENDRASAIGSVTCGVDLPELGVPPDGEKNLAGGDASRWSLTIPSSLLLSDRSLRILTPKKDLTLKKERERHENQALYEKAATLLITISRELIGKPHTAGSFHDYWERRLTEEGWHVRRAVPIYVPALQQQGQFDLVVTWPVPIAIELDNKAVRDKSILKLQAFPGMRVVVLRGPHAKHGAGVDLILACDCPQQKSQERDLATDAWIQEVKASNLFPNIDPELVYRKCLHACLQKNIECSKRRVLAWCEREYPPLGGLAKPRCKVCNKPVAEGHRTKCWDHRYMR